jgi:hypothetical protein
VGTFREITIVETALAASSQAVVTSAFTGAATGSAVSASFRAAVGSSLSVVMAAPPRVTSAGVVSFTFANLSTDAATISAATIDCTVEKY